MVRGMPAAVPAISLSATDRDQIDRWLDAQDTPQQVALRSRIVLAAAAGHSDSGDRRRAGDQSQDRDVVAGALRRRRPHESVGDRAGARAQADL